ncbi:TlpA family protein disulfide reductase [Chryseobacterium sp. c4a]|uniref:TlpA family protein disulfide reductase n=1 Tax=Chryseobacterium sp. c4a TaxID=1573582 RepID=UPI0013598626|nr:TlpA disulfide reductase family protein [Chryseobacterium sp. c4a]
MENVKKWIKAHGSTTIMMVVLIIVLVNPDAKAWLMRQVASTGILNSSISKSVDKSENAVAYTGLMVKNENGTLIDPSQWKGKVVFINFWASWCPPCRAEFPSVQKFYDQYKSHPDMVFLTINLDDNVALGKNYLKRKGFTIPFITPAASIPEALYNGSLPTTVVLDKKGAIRLHHTGVADYSKASFYEQIDSLLK